MKFDFQTSMGVLCAVTALTYAGCDNSGSKVAVQDVPKESVSTHNTSTNRVIFTPATLKSEKRNSAHSSHGAHLSHSSHASSRY